MSKLSKLFRWSKKVDIVDYNGKLLDTVFIRLVGDNDYQDARNEALRRSKSLRLTLKDKKTDGYKALFLDIDDLDKEIMVNNIVIAEISSYRDEGMASMPEFLEMELSDSPTLEEQEEKLASDASIPDKKIEKLSKFISDKCDERQVVLNKLKIEEVRKLYIESLVANKCIEEFSRFFREYCIYKGVFEDEKLKKPAFSSFDEFLDISPTLKSQLMDAYSKLEVSGEDLKN